jgi:hypothetical protein
LNNTRIEDRRDPTHSREGSGAFGNENSRKFPLTYATGLYKTFMRIVLALYAENVWIDPANAKIYNGIRFRLLATRALPAGIAIRAIPLIPMASCRFRCRQRMQ